VESSVRLMRSPIWATAPTSVIV